MSKIPEGLCQCGCGGQTRIAPKTSQAKQWIKGRPLRFLPNHQSRLLRGPRATLSAIFAEATYWEPNSGCLLWAGPCNNHRRGYGQITRGKGRSIYAHQLAWILAGRLLPKKPYILRHKCDTPCCVNIDHLEVGTVADNQADMARRDRGIKGRLRYGVAQRRSGRFSAKITFRRQQLCLGTFDTEAEAHVAAVRAKNELYGRRLYA